MKLDTLTNYSIFSYTVIAVLLLSIIILIAISMNSYWQKQRSFRLEIAICIVFILLMASLYYRLVYLKFQSPPNALFSIQLYTAKPNSSGGFNEERDEITFEKYSQIIDILNNTSLAHKITDRNKDSRNFMQRYILIVIPYFCEPDSVYLRELRLYVNEGDKFESYVIVTENEQEQTYQIIDKKIIMELITAINNRY